MSWKKALSLVLLLVIGFIAFVPHQAVAEGSFVNPYSNLLSGLDFNGRYLKSVEFGDDRTPLYLRYPIWGYQFTNTLGSNLTGLALINALLSLAMVAMAGAALVVIGIITWAFNYTGLDGIVPTVDRFVELLTNKLFFSEFLVVALFGLGVSLMFSFGRNDDVAGKLIKVIFNLILSFTILANMGTLLDGLTKLGRTGSDIVLRTYVLADPSGKTYVKDPENKGVDALVKMGNDFFEYNVYLPFQLANFGIYVPERKIEAAKNNNVELSDEEQQVIKDTKEHFKGYYGNVFVSALENAWKNIKENFKAIVAAGESIYNNVMEAFGLDEAKTNIATDAFGKAYLTMTPFGLPFRILIVWLTFVIGTAYGCLLLAIAGVSILCQIFMYLLAIFAPFIFLLNLIPEWGDRILLKFVEFLVISGVYKVLSTLVLVGVLFLQGAIYSSANNWLYAMFSQLLLVMAVFLFRRQIGELIPLAGVAVFQGAEDQLYKGSKQAVHQLINKTIDVGQKAVAGSLAVAGVATGTPLLTKGLQMTGGTFSRMAGAFAESKANERRQGGSGPTTERDRKPGPTPLGPIQGGGRDEDDPPDGDDFEGGPGGGGRGPDKGPDNQTGPRGGGGRRVGDEDDPDGVGDDSFTAMGRGSVKGRGDGTASADDGDDVSPVAHSRRRAVDLIDPTSTLRGGDTPTHFHTHYGGKQESGSSRSDLSTGSGPTTERIIERSTTVQQQPGTGSSTPATGTGGASSSRSDNLNVSGSVQVTGLGSDSKQVNLQGMSQADINRKFEEMVNSTLNDLREANNHNEGIKFDGDTVDNHDEGVKFEGDTVDNHDEDRNFEGGVSGKRSVSVGDAEENDKKKKD